MGTPFRIHSKLKTDMENYTFPPSDKAPLKQRNIDDMLMTEDCHKKELPHRAAHDNNGIQKQKIDSDDESDSEPEVIDSEDGYEPEKDEASEHSDADDIADDPQERTEQIKERMKKLQK